METITIDLALKKKGKPVRLTALINQAGARLRANCPDTMTNSPYLKGHKATTNKQPGRLIYAGYEIENERLQLFYDYQKG